MGFSWSKDDGLRLYQDGETVAINTRGEQQLRSEKLLDRVIIGRANDNYEFRDFGDFAFEDMAIVKSFLNEPRFRKRFLLPG